jgi:hypothetical protein
MIELKVSEWNSEARPLLMVLHNLNMPEPAIAVQERKIFGPAQTSRGFFEHWQGIMVKFCLCVEAPEVHTEPILGFPSRVLLGTKMLGADHGEERPTITPFANISSTCDFITSLSAKGVLYWGRLMGVVSFSII